MSGQVELNHRRILPEDVYYRYTMSRRLLSIQKRDLLEKEVSGIGTMFLPTLSYILYKASLAYPKPTLPIGDWVSECVLR